MTQTTTTRKAPVKRTYAMRMNLSEGMTERFRRVAELYGLPPSTLGAYAIGQWTSQQEASLRLVDTMAETLGEQMGEELKKQFALFDKSTGGSKA